MQTIRIFSSQGSCGYGKLDKGQWPYWSVAALSSSNSFALKGPVTGCGCVASSYIISNGYDCASTVLDSDLQDVHEQLACSVCCAGSAPRSCAWVLLPLPEAFSLEDGVPLSGTDSLLKFSCRQCFEVKCLDTAPFAGRCITGANAVSVIVQITDICPECAADHLDIQALTYNKLSPMDTGRINIQYR